jgi:ribose/xylose/arabinose/galactoside ABC-type transport system permease subunit
MFSSVFLGLLAAVLLTSVFTPSFFRPSNLLNVLRQASALGIVSVGQTIVIVGGGVDLSIAATMQLATVMAAELARGEDGRLPFAIAVCLLLGMLVGLINGLLVTRRKVPPFVATLAVSVLVTGIRLAYTQANPSGTLPPMLRVVGQGAVAHLPVAFVTFALIAGIAHVALTRTTFGRALYATGGNPQTAHLSGVFVARIIVATYVLSGILAAVGGLVLAGYIGYADQWIGRGSELDSIAAAVVGGASFAGGVGTIVGTVGGVLLIASLQNIVLLLGLDPSYQLVISGFVVMLAVAVQSVRFRLRRP